MKMRLLLALLCLPCLSPAATQTVIPGPPGSGSFGTRVAVLPNGNFVVTDPGFDQVSPAVADVGAVYLYSPQGGLISTLVGSQTNDRVGSGVVVLANGHFVVASQNWSNGMAFSAGAVTWGHAETGWGLGQVVPVSAANSLVGSQVDDYVGGVVSLRNGNYLVRSLSWRNGAAVSAGAVTWCDGQGGTVGPVSPANSLVGSRAGDQVGHGLTILSNNNYVVRSPSWDNDGVADAGAVTWGSGSSGISGPVTSANSLVGSQANDQVGSQNVGFLSNGHYVVSSPNWNNGVASKVGAATWGSGSTGITGPVTPVNSLIGSTDGDQVGLNGITALTNGNYVVRSANWDNGGVVDAGAVTWGNGNMGTTGEVTPANSLVGSSANEQVGSADVTTLSNGNYVVHSPNWDNGAVTNAGAATWGNGTTGISGLMTPANSLVGSQANDQIGSTGITVLKNGHYVVRSPNWDNGAAVDAGAVSWGNGTTGITGPVTPANSLVGSQANDQIGSTGITALNNGHYVVRSPNWDNGVAVDAGAVTWGNGTTGITGPVTPANSLVGSQAGDRVSGIGVTALANGHYVVRSPNWSNGAAANAGAATWCNGSRGITGPISPANSLVGTQAGDMVGRDGRALTNGHYVVSSFTWRNGSVFNAGAVTWGNGQGGTVGPVSAANSLVGTSTNDHVGWRNVTPLSNGHYVAYSRLLNNGATFNTDAVTWCNGQGGTVGPITPANSLVGGAFGDLIGNGGIRAFADGNYTVDSSLWSNAVNPYPSAITLADGQTGEVGLISPANSVIGLTSSTTFVFAYDATRQRLFVADRTSQRLVIHTPTRLHSQAKSGQGAPGAMDIAFAAPGAVAVGGDGGALFEAALIGSGAKGGKRGLFSPWVSGLVELVLRQGDALSALGAGLPANATVATLGGPLRQGGLGGIFQTTVKGSGLNARNNRLLLRDGPGGVSALLRSGQAIPALGGASLNRPLEVAQSHNEDVIALTYALNKGAAPAVTGANDTGLLLLRHDGSVQGGAAAREGAAAFGGGGALGQFNGRVAAGQGNTVHFGALFRPAVGKAVPALFRTTLDGVTKARTAAVGDAAPGAGGATFASFRGLSQIGDHALFTATLKGSPKNANEGLWRGDGIPVLTRKGDNLGGVTITRLLRFWPAGDSQILLHAQLSDKSQALILRQSNASYLILLRTGQAAPGVGPARLRAISAVDVNPVTGLYTVLGTLAGAPATANQALWSGNPNLGNDTTETIYRLPVLRLRKGQTYRTENTPQSVLRAISLRPAVDPTGAGGRGLAQAIGSGGQIGLVLTGDRKLHEVVVLK